MNATASDTKRYNDALRALYARGPDELVADVQAAAQRLVTATRAWSTETPGRAAIDEALSTAHGLQRALAGLHSAPTGHAEVKPDAA